MLKVLMVGSNGNISESCRDLFYENGYDLTVINRKYNNDIPETIKQVIGDINKMDRTDILRLRKTFDVVIDFLCYNKEQARQRIRMFNGLCMQYVFISTTAFYDRKKMKTPFSEDEVIVSWDWEYAFNKYKAEEEFLKAHRMGFRPTIMRPCHTFAKIMPTMVGNNDWTVIQRIINKKPIVLAERYNSLNRECKVRWTLMHSTAFAIMLSKTLGNEKAILESYHTSDSHGIISTWESIYGIIAKILKINELSIVYTPAEEIFRRNPYVGAGIMHHKRYNDIYSDFKIAMLPEINYGKENKPQKPTLNICVGLKKVINYYKENSLDKTIDIKMDKMFDELCIKYQHQEKKYSIYIPKIPKVTELSMFDKTDRYSYNTNTERRWYRLPW